MNNSLSWIKAKLVLRKKNLFYKVFFYLLKCFLYTLFILCLLAYYSYFTYDIYQYFNQQLF